MARSLGVKLLALAAALAAHAKLALAQGGWVQWDIHLRDGSRVEANPLGAPDSAHFSISVGGFEGHDVTILRSLVDYIAAPLNPRSDREAQRGDTLPPLPAARACEDVVVRRDGRQSAGRVTVRRIMYSAGTLAMGTDVIDLTDVAYIRFAQRQGDCARRRTRRRLTRSAHAP